MPREPIQTWFYALVVVRSHNRFLLIQEPTHGQKWFVPSGRVEPGETLAEAAAREALEEGGIPVVLDGILRIEHQPFKENTARVRVIFIAHPQDDTPPKSNPDRESLGAVWVALAELENLPLREEGVKEMLKYVANGAPIYPLELITFIGAPFTVLCK